MTSQESSPPGSEKPRHRHRFPLIVAVILLVLYIAFLRWIGGSGRPLEPTEIDAYMTLIEKGSADYPEIDSTVLANFRSFAESDDGKPFYNVNLIKFRKQTAYPAGKDPGGTPAEANARYGKALLPLLLARGSYPMLQMQPLSVLKAAGPGTDSWDMVGVVRYRSRRDFMSMLAQPEYSKAEVNKWAAIQETIIIPASEKLFLAPNLWVFLALAAIGLVLVFGERLLARWRHGR